MHTLRSLHHDLLPCSHRAEEEEEEHLKCFSSAALDIDSIRISKRGTHMGLLDFSRMSTASLAQSVARRSHNTHIHLQQQAVRHPEGVSSILTGSTFLGFWHPGATREQFFWVSGIPQVTLVGWGCEAGSVMQNDFKRHIGAPEPNLHTYTKTPVLDTSHALPQCEVAGYLCHGTGP